MTDAKIEAAMTFPDADEAQRIVGPELPPPIMQATLVRKAQLKKMIKSHGFQMGTDFYHALNDKATRLVLDAMYRMMEKGWRVRVGVQDL